MPNSFLLIMTLSSPLSKHSSVKRARKLSPYKSPEVVEITNDEFWPRFLVIEGRDSDKPLSQLNCFKVEKAFQGLIGTTKNVSRNKTGAIIVEVERKAQSDKLLTITAMNDIPVEVFPHKTLNFTKGVVRSFQLANIETDELVNELEDQGVVEAIRISSKRNGIKVPTSTVILKFKRAQLPDHIKAGYHRIKVSPYIPNPLRCFNCQKFGHHISNCKKAKICAKCALSDHGENPCPRSETCINCNGPHPSYFSSCPKWKHEKEICKRKVHSGISYAQARKEVENSQREQLYSDAARKQLKQLKSYRTYGTQTDVINCTCVAEAPFEDSSNFANSETQTEPIFELSSSSLSVNSGCKPQKSLSSIEKPISGAQKSGSDIEKPKNKGQSGAPPSRAPSLSPKGQRPSRSMSSGGRVRQRIDMFNLSKDVQSAIRLENRFKPLEEMETGDPPPDPSREAGKKPGDPPDPNQGAGKKPLVKITAPI